MKPELHKDDEYLKGSVNLPVKTKHWTNDQQFRKYKVDFTHRWSGKVLTFTLSIYKDESQNQLKEIKRDYSFMWKVSKIYC